MIAVLALPAMAQVNLSGVWGARYHEDWPDRFPGPELGDYGGVPINDANRLRALTWDARSVTLDDGRVLQATAVIFCGGSVGSTWAGEVAIHRAGTLLKLDRAVTGVPVSFGAYLAPSATGGVLGATFETPAKHWHPPALPLPSLGWLLGKGEALADLSGARVTGRWTGSRLSGLQAGVGTDGVWRLSGLGSQGILLGPLLAGRERVVCSPR